MLTLPLFPSFVLCFSLAGVSLAGKVDVSVGAGIDDSNAKIASGWFAGWHATEGFPVSAIDWSRYNSMIYSFASTTGDIRNITLQGSDPESLPIFVAEAHAHDVEAMISIGGWDGSIFYSNYVGSAQNRTAFVKTVVSFVKKYDLDGVNFDWEYPGAQGIGCNTVSPNDTSNLLAFLQELRDDPIGADIVLTAAVALNPFTGADGTPSKDVSAFAKVLDYIQIMNYDVWGPWSATVGPNAPLNDTCAAPENQQGSAVYGVSAWAAAGFPRDQIILGVPGYSHSFSVTPENAFKNGTKTLQLYAPFNASISPLGDAWDNTSSVDSCGVLEPPGGTFNFWALVEDGYLDTKGNPVPGVPYIYDECSQTPFTYNETTQVMISFDNAKSFAAKGSFIQQNQLAGFAIWEVASDYHDILIDAIRAELFDDDC